MTDVTAGVTDMQVKPMQCNSSVLRSWPSKSRQHKIVNKVNFINLNFIISFFGVHWGENIVFMGDVFGSL